MVKYLESLKAKLTDSELWIGGGNARFKSTALGPSILTGYGVKVCVGGDAGFSLHGGLVKTTKSLSAF